MTTSDAIKILKEMSMGHKVQVREGFLFPHPSQKDALDLAIRELEEGQKCHELCTNGKDSYHDWNTKHYGRCQDCGYSEPEKPNGDCVYGCERDKHFCERYPKTLKIEKIISPVIYGNCPNWGTLTQVLKTLNQIIDYLNND